MYKEYYRNVIVFLMVVLSLSIAGPLFANVYTYSPAMGSYAGCTSGATTRLKIDYYTCTSLSVMQSYDNNLAKFSLYSHNTTTGSMTFRFSKCTGSFGAAGKVFVENGGTYWCATYSGSPSYVDVVVPSGTFTGLKSFEGYVVSSAQTTWLFTGEIDVNGIASPYVHTSISQYVSGSSVDVSGEINGYYGNTTYYVQYGQTAGYGSQTSTSTLSPTNGLTSVNKIISGLSSYTVYHFRFVASNQAGTTYGDDATFFITEPLTLIAPGTSGSPGPVLTTLTPDFSWNQVTGGNEYVLNVVKVSNNAVTFSQNLGNVSSYSMLPGVLEPLTAYSWTVATNVNGNAVVSVNYYFQTPQIVSAPTIQAGNLTFANIQQNQADVAWTIGNGNNRIVKINTTNSFTPPVNNTNYPANSVYTGSGEQVVYNGTGTAIPTVTGLAAGTTYYFQVWEYNVAGSSITYCLASGTGNPMSQQTVTTQPVAPSNGNGTANNPYLIENLANLRWLSEVCPAALLTGVYYKLTADINASETAVWNPSGSLFSGFIPIGTFNGSFDGNGKTISNLFIRHDTYTGLFRLIWKNGKVYNLTLQNVTIHGYFWTGAFTAENWGTLYNCRVSGNLFITGMLAGGITGNHYGRMSYCFADCNVISTSAIVGGIAGINAYGSIRYCASTGNVSGHDTVGGLVGENDNGGIIGNCFSSGQITNGAGLFGYLGPNANPYHCFAYGHANYGFARFCMKDPATVLRCYYNSDSCSAVITTKTTIGVTGLTTSDFQNQNKFELFDFPFVWHMGALHPEISVTDPFPVDFPLAGEGIPELPYQIGDLSNLQYFDEHVNLSHSSFKLTNSIDATATRTWHLNDGVYNGFTPISDYPGVFDGNNKTISGLYINFPGSNYVGLFSSLSGGTVKNLVLEGLTVNGGFSTAGIAGYTWPGYITGCSVSGFISGTNNTGGIVGYLGIGNVQNCISRSLIKCQPDGSFGGIAGTTYTGQAFVDHCIFTGGVLAGQPAGSGYIGAMIGLNFGSYLTSSFYDFQTADTNLAIGYNLYEAPYTATGLTTSSFLLNSSFNSWSGSWGTTSQAPWQQPNSKTRPYLFFEQVVVSNGKFTLYDNNIVANGYFKCISGGPVIEAGYIINNSEEPWYNLASSRIFPVSVSLANGANMSLTGAPIAFPYLTPGDDYFVTCYAKTSSGSVFYGDVTYSKHVVASSPANQLTLSNISVLNGQSFCFNAIQTLTVAGGGTTFIVQSGANVQMIAGQKLQILAGTKIYSGGYYHGWITSNNTYCYPTKNSIPEVSSVSEPVLQQESGSPDSKQSVKVYPNPAKESVTLEFSFEPVETPVLVQCFNMIGAIVLEKEFLGGLKQQLSLKECKSGIYMLKITHGNNQFYHKIIKLID